MFGDGQAICGPLPPRAEERTWQGGRHVEDQLLEPELVESRDRPALARGTPAAGTAAHTVCRSKTFPAPVASSSSLRQEAANVSNSGAAEWPAALLHAGNSRGAVLGGSIQQSPCTLKSLNSPSSGSG